jgi:hypothetical protein
LECNLILLWFLWAFLLGIFWHRKVPLIHLALASCVSGTFLCQFIKHVRHSETCFSVLDRQHYCSYLSRQKHQVVEHFKVLRLTVSKTGKMWHGHSLMGSHWHIRDLTQNLPLQSVWSYYRFRPPKHHHCLPETLPEMLVSKSSVSLIWIYIYIYTVSSKLICEMHSRAVTL